MPNFERTLSTGKSNLSNSYSYDKIFATIRGSANKSVFARTNRISVSFKDTETYKDKLSKLSDEDYQMTAGCDLSALFVPYQSKAGASGGMPAFHSSLPSGNSDTITIHKLLPFEWASGTTTTIKDRWSSPSGDSLRSVTSSERYLLDINEYRDLNNTRMIGQRLPMVGVGWGYTTDGDPWPSGDRPAGSTAPPGTKFFKGGKERGIDVDPSDYIAAPIDFRYDKDRGVWATTAQRGIWAILQETSGVVRNGASGVAWQWREAESTGSGIYQVKAGGKAGSYTRTSTYTEGPAYEVNHANANVGTVVWMEKETAKDHWSFTWHLPRGTSRWQVLQLVDDIGTIGWDWPRFHR